MTSLSKLVLYSIISMCAWVLVKTLLHVWNGNDHIYMTPYGEQEVGG